MYATTRAWVNQEFALYEEQSKKPSKTVEVSQEKHTVQVVLPPPIRRKPVQMVKMLDGRVID